MALPLCHGGDAEASIEQLAGREPPQREHRAVECQRRPRPWAKGTRAQTDSISGNVTAGGNTTRTLGVTGVGTVSATVDWSSSTPTSDAWNATVANLRQNDQNIVVGATAPSRARSGDGPPATAVVVARPAT